MSDLNAEIEAGRALERAGKHQDAIEHFRRLVAQHPDDPRIRFEHAGAHDSGGYEDLAIPIYREALRLGLSSDYLPRLYLQLGSSLRNVEQFEEAAAVLSEGCRLFPDHTALRIFRALALHSAGRHREAMVELIDLLLAALDDAALDGYRRAIRYYPDDLKPGG